jgi:hypothetical protein
MKISFKIRSMWAENQTCDLLNYAGVLNTWVLLTHTESDVCYWLLSGNSVAMSSEIVQPLYLQAVHSIVLKSH